MNHSINISTRPLFLSIGLLAILLSGCKTTKPDPEVSDQREAAYTEAKVKTQENKTLDFDSFLGTLRSAVARKDMEVVASLMTPTFGFQLSPMRQGDGVFQYWDEKGLWSELELVLKENFSPLGNYMVAPQAFAFAPESYSGYRAGMIETAKGWRFAYFVTD